MRKTLVLALLLFLSGVIYIEVGLCSILISIAYAQFKGSLVPALVGVIMIILGGVSITLVHRMIFRKEESSASLF
ncbi:MAG: hypothetical protein LBF22_15095 [Deltaproteobacteria bacterium]|nr:hypothetical protein [Deltaproteobacteria bacterium]